MLCVLTIDCGVPSKLSRRVGFRLSLSSQPNPTPFASSPPSPSSISSSLLLLLLDLSDLIGGLAIVCRAGAACAPHVRQQAFHGSPMVELVLNRCLIVESSSHGQGHLDLLAGLGAECAVAVHALDSVARPSLVAFALPILSKLANIGLLLASGIGVAVADVFAPC